VALAPPGGLALDPIDSAYAALASRAVDQPSGAASIHSPLCFSKLAVPDHAADLVSAPALAVAVVIVAADDTVFVSPLVGDRDELFTWTLDDAGAQLASPTSLDQICSLVGEQVAGDWTRESTAVPSQVVTFAALALDGDRVLAGFHEGFEPQADGTRSSPGEIASHLVAAVDALATVGDGESIELVAPDGDPDVEETWQVEEPADQGLVERLQDLREQSGVEISVVLEGAVSLIATGPNGTVVLTDAAEGRVRVRESRRGALAEVLEVIRAGGFGERAGGDAAEDLAELLPRVPGQGGSDPGSDDDDGGDEFSATDDPRELVVMVTAETGDGGSATDRLLFVETPDGCYFVQEPDGNGETDGPATLPLMPVGTRGILGRTAGALLWTVAQARALSEAT
jgi:hypothetical protein